MSQPVQNADEADIEAIDAVREAHVTAINNGDIDAWASVFADDAVQMPPQSPANRGTRSIRTWCESFLSPYHATFMQLACELHVAGRWAFERGSYRITLSPKAGGESMQDIGKYLTVYERKEGGSWRIARDIWNSNLRPSPGAERRARADARPARGREPLPAPDAVRGRACPARRHELPPQLPHLPCGPASRPRPAASFRGRLRRRSGGRPDRRAAVPSRLRLPPSPSAAPRRRLLTSPDTEHRMKALSLLAAAALAAIVLPAAAAPEGLVELRSPHGAKATMDRFEEAARQRGLNVFARIDHAAGAAKAGKSLRPTEVLIFGNPQGGTPLMECAQTAGIDLPLKALVREDASGQVWLAYNDPAWIARRHEAPQCAAADNLRKALAGLAETAVAER